MEESLKQAVIENQQGMLFYNEKYYGSAAEFFKKSAEKGSAAALYNLAKCYKLGHGLKKDKNKALELYHQAADKGFAPAQCLIGLQYAMGDGVPQSYSRALEYYKRADAQEYAEAQCNLGSYYSEVENNIDLALHYFEKAAKNRSIAAIYFLGSYWEERQAFGKAREYYEQGVRLKDPTSALALRELEEAHPELRPLLDGVIFSAPMGRTPRATTPSISASNLTTFTPPTSAPGSPKPGHR